MSNNISIRILTSIILLLILISMFLNQFFLTYVIIILSIISFIEFSSVLKKIKIKKILILLFNAIFIIYIILFSILFFLLSNIFTLKIILFFAIVICVFSDTGGLVVGKTIGGPKLTSISPNKTISGSFGSFLFSIIASLIFNLIFPGIQINKLILFALTVSLGCQIGDIVFSFVKRKAKVKDYGKILPGHGGVLDRIDGLLLGVPFGLVTLIILINFI